MILICSEENDFSTLEVEKWLRASHVNYFRINKEDGISIKEINISSDSVTISVDGKLIDLKSISVFWYRRGFFNIEYGSNTHLRKIYKAEAYDLNSFLFKYLLDHSISINNYLFSNVNKLLVLQLAQKNGLKIPETIITGLRPVAEGFVKSSEGTITKVIGSQLMVHRKNTILLGYTEAFSLDYLEQFDASFFPSLIQRKIKKKYEIRAFLLNNTFYSMAIFSQSNTATSTDFRRYDAANPNRTVPYKLPRIVEEQLKALFESLHLNSGSADIIMDQQGDYIFLEINPVGQFSMVSKPCNYYIEKKLSKHLVNHE